MDTISTPEHFPAARFIKEIGRGKKGARSLSHEDAQQLYAAMLDGRVSDLELGGIMLAMRIKGESVSEIAGFLQAAEASFAPLAAPSGEFAPVIIPSYNGSRQMANLTPLLASLLAREGVPVLVHGVVTDPGRVTTAQILQQLGVVFTTDHQQVAERFAARQPAFMQIDHLAPKMARLLAMRRILGVRNSTHTLVKLLQPFDGPALRLTSYTHPEYLAMLTEYFSSEAPVGRGDVFLMHGTEGETVANAKRAHQIAWFHERACATLVERQEPVDELPVLPAADAESTASWIREVLADRQPVPPAIAEQVAHCLRVAKAIRAAQD
jgi:anthranilate phosphoribosyltransferase